jgi:hypothetical protein
MEHHQNNFKNRDEKPDQTMSDIDRMFNRQVDDARPEND